jgi:hypothetical protein
MLPREASAGHEPGLEHRYVDSLGHAPLQLMSVVEDCQLGVGVGGARRLQGRRHVRPGGLGDLEWVRPLGRRDHHETAYPVGVVRVGSHQHDAGRRGERVQQAIDELGMGKVVHGEGELVTVGRGVAGVDDREPGIGHQAPQGKHRLGREEVLHRGTGRTYVGKACQVATDLVHRRPSGTSLVADIMERLSRPAHEQQAGPLPFWPARHRHGCRASETSGGSGDQDGS